MLDFFLKIIFILLIMGGVKEFDGGGGIIVLYGIGYDESGKKYSGNIIG